MHVSNQTVGRTKRLYLMFSVIEPWKYNIYNTKSIPTFSLVSTRRENYSPLSSHIFSCLVGAQIMHAKHFYTKK